MGEGRHANPALVEVLNALEVAFKDMASLNRYERRQFTAGGCLPNLVRVFTVDNPALTLNEDLQVAVENSIGICSDVATKGQTGGIAGECEGVYPAAGDTT
jgi:hypothetical protein